MSFLSRVKIVAGVGDTDYPYYHVSNHSETPTPYAHEGTKHLDPEGIYLFIKGKSVDQTDWVSKKYRWDAKVKGGISDVSDPDWNKLLKGLGIDVDHIEDYFKSIEKPFDEYKIQDILEDDIPTWREHDEYHIWAEIAWTALLEYFKDGSKFAHYLIKNNIKALKDDHGDVLFRGEPQILILDPSLIEWGDREENISDSSIYVLK